VPANLPRRPALVVVLHGCGQSAPAMISAPAGRRWRSVTLCALMPEQQPSNNANTCFNWFNPEDVARDQGEACSIRQMIEKMAAIIHQPKPHLRHRPVRRRAMTSAMLATYPEVFCAGAVIAGCRSASRATCAKR